MRVLCVMCLAMVAGCGPFAIGFGGVKALESDNTDQRELNVALLRTDPTPDFVNLAEFTADAAATREIVVETNKPAQVDALLVGPGHLATVGDSDASGCPLAFQDSAIARVFAGRVAAGADPNRLFAMINLPGPLADGAYTLWVRARDDVGQVQCISFAWTRDTVLPTFVPKLVVEASVPRALELNWDAATDERTGVAGYRVYWDVGGRSVPDDTPRTPGTTYNFAMDGAVPQGAFAGPMTTVTTELQLSNLLAGRAHYVQVTAFDAAGNETPLTVNDVLLPTRSGADGTFLPATPADTFAMGPNAADLTVGDFNGDGVPDFAAIEFFTERISYRLGQGPPGRGDGTFSARQTFAVRAPATLLRMEAADVDRDGDDDLVAVEFGADFSSARTLLAVAGPNVFEERTTFDFTVVGPAGPEGQNIAARLSGSILLKDMDADGTPDLIAGADLGNSGLVGAAYSREQGRGIYGGPAVDGLRIKDSGLWFFGSPKAADFNSDNVLDIVFLDRSSVRLLLHRPDLLDGGGPGEFEESIPYSAGAEPACSALGDWNGDQIPDLTVVNLDGQVRVLAGVGSNGRGEGALRLLPIAARIDGLPGAIVTGDFNDDAIQDIALTQQFPNAVTVLLGNGENGVPNATFRVAQTLFLDEAPNSIVARDVTGDGILDLLILLPNEGEPEAQMQILRGRGARAVPTLDYTTVRFQFSRPVDGVATGDFNGDGVDDVVFGIETPGAFGGVFADLSVTRSRNGRGLAFAGDFEGIPFAAGFAGSVGFPGGLAFATGDFDNNGILDVAAQPRGIPRFPAGRDTPELEVLFGRGMNGRAEGSFAPSADPATNAFGSLPLPDPPFTICTPEPIVGRPVGPRAIVSGDFNGDGLADVATLNEVDSVVRIGQFGLPGPRSTVAVFLGQGDPGRGDMTFALDAHYFAPCRAESLVAADFDGDHVADLALSSVEDEAIILLSGGTRTVFNPFLDRLGVIGDGTFATPTAPPDELVEFETVPLPGPSIVQIVAGDFDRDGNNDLAVLHSLGIRILLGDGAGGFATGGEVLLDTPIEIAAHDLDNDGVLDLAVILAGPTAETSQLAIVRGLRDASGSPNGSLEHVRTVEFEDAARGIAFGDFNGDAIPDIVVGGGFFPCLLLGKGTVVGE